MNPIEIQSHVSNIAFNAVKNKFHKANIYEVFSIYEMLIEDFYYKQQQLLQTEMEKYFDSFVTTADIALENAQFYISDAFNKGE